MILFSKDTCNELIALYRTKKISLEGNILKVIKGGDAEFLKYVEEAKQRDNDTRRKRLEITKQVQQQNRDLIDSQADRDKLMAELKVALSDSEKLRDAAVEDLETLQKRTQFELVGLIVKVALGIIGTVAFLTSILYFYVISKGLDAKIIESTWSNLFGILLTNSFSIIGTIMGVKYASGDKG